MLKQFLDSYQAYDAAEEADRKAFLYFLNQIDNDSVYDRANLIGHLTASAWVVNPARDKVLMIHHNIYQAWAWLGGHADKEKDLLKVARKEVQEESGVKNLKLLLKDPIEIDICKVEPHVKKGQAIAAHLHYNVVYLFEADENESVCCKADENSAVSWIRMDSLIKLCPSDSITGFYVRVIQKLKDFDWLKRNPFIK